MPELPEVETVVRDLREPLVGRTIVGLASSGIALRRSGANDALAGAVGRTIASVTRRGKWIRIDLGEPALLAHLGMTGQLTVVAASTPVPSHLHRTFTLDDGRELRFRDIRRFGSLGLFADAAALDAYFAKQKLGPEPFGVPLEHWVAALAKARRAVKACLLDQRVVAGVGNIYADEALFEARLAPSALACNLKRDAVARLAEAVASVLTRAIARRGSTIRDYVGGSGLAGGFQEELRVYGRTGEPCVVCRTPITRLVLGGRSTHFCPKCQRSPRR